MTRRLISRLGLSAVMGMAAAGCKGKTETPPNPPATAYDATPAAQGADFWSPFDAAPSSQADMIYFTALTTDGAGVFKVAAENGTPAPLFVGAPLVSPFGVMPDGADAFVFVVDSGSEGDVADDEEDTTVGRIFKIDTAGGTPVSMTAAEGTAPKSLDVLEQNGDELVYFTGRDPTTKAPAVFSMDTGGAALTTIVSGAPLADPSGIAVASDGTIYLADVAAENNDAAILRIKNGVVEVFKSDLRVGYPAGVALTLDEKQLFVSGLKKDEGTSVVHVIDLASGDVDEFDKNIGQNQNSAGVHRARQADAFAWADSNGTESQPGGTVYFIPKR